MTPERINELANEAMESIETDDGEDYAFARVAIEHAIKIALDEQRVTVTDITASNANHARAAADAQRLLQERDEAKASFLSLCVELWEGVRTHGLTAPTKGRDGERLIHAYCGGIARLRNEIEDEKNRADAAIRERDEARAELAEQMKLCETHQDKSSRRVAQRDRRIAELVAALRAARAYGWRCTNIGGGMHYDCIAWKEKNPDHVLCRACSVVAKIDAALSAPAKPATPLMAELNAASRAVDVWPQRLRDLRDLSIRAEEHFAQPATATKDVCSHASRYLLRGEVTCVVCNQAIDVTAPPSPAAREATTCKYGNDHTATYCMECVDDESAAISAAYKANRCPRCGSTGGHLIDSAGHVVMCANDNSSTHEAVERAIDTATLLVAKLDCKDGRAFMSRDASLQDYWKRAREAITALDAARSIKEKS